MVKVDHNRRCFIADLDFGEDREALDKFYFEWMELIDPWCVRDPEGNMKYTVGFRGYAEILDQLRPSREVSVVPVDRDLVNLLTWYRENYGGSRLFMKRILEYIQGSTPKVKSDE